VLTVTDKAGASSSDTVTVHVGNTLPSVAIQTTSNSTFFFPKSTALDYNVTVSDKEDETVDNNKVLTSLKYIPRVAEKGNAAGHQQLDADYNFGKTLVASSDCKACHQVTAKSVGPSFAAVAQKYRGDITAVGYLANKIITGGGGVWGEHAMSAHPQLSKDDAMEMVKYVLSVSDKQNNERLPQQGSLVLNQHLDKADQGRYLLTASYTDKGGAIAPLTNKATLYLRPAKVQVEQADKVYNMERSERNLGRIHNGSYFMLAGIDLKDVTALTYRYASDKDAAIKVRVDSLRGPVISSLDFTPTDNWNTFKEVTTEINDPGGKHDLYFVFVRPDTPNKHLASLDWVRFEGGKEAVEKPKVAAKESKEAKPSKAAGTATAKGKEGKVGNTGVTKEKAVSISKSAAAAGNALIQKSDCRVCHAQNAKLVGPSFVQIATRYKNKSGAIPMLAGRIIQGGAGNWGQVPMTPHPQLSKKDAATMVQYILSLNK
jgi:cytochrome c